MTPDINRQPYDKPPAWLTRAKKAGFNIETHAPHGVKFKERKPRERAAYKLAAKFAAKGGKKGQYSYQAPWTPKCDNPVSVFMVAPGHAPSNQRPIEVDMLVPCRKCETCLKVKSNLWRRRALREVALSVRTWSVTLTFSTPHLAICSAKAMEMGRRGTFAKRMERAAYSEIQLFLKRVRKNSGRQIKYLAVCEHGEQQGRIHYHVLIHERGGPISKRQIEGSWPSISHCRLVRNAERQAGYVVKYVTKSPDAPIRASRSYGSLLHAAKQRVRSKEINNEATRPLNPSLKTLDAPLNNINNTLIINKQGGTSLPPQPEGTHDVPRHANSKNADITLTLSSEFLSKVGSSQLKRLIGIYEAIEQKTGRNPIPPLIRSKGPERPRSTSGKRLHKVGSPDTPDIVAQNRSKRPCVD